MADKININTANIQQLCGIPGIGPVKAKAIIDHRQRYGSVSKEALSLLLMGGMDGDVVRSLDFTTPSPYHSPLLSPVSSVASRVANLEKELEREIDEVGRQLHSLRMSERKPIQSELDRAIMDLPSTPVGLHYVASDPRVVPKIQPMAYSHKPDCVELREPRLTKVSIDPDLQMLYELQETTNTQIKLLNQMLEEQRRLQHKIEGKKAKPSNVFSTNAYIGTNSGDGAIGLLPAVATTSRVGSAPGDGVTDPLPLANKDSPQSAELARHVQVRPEDYDPEYAEWIREKRSRPGFGHRSDSVDSMPSNALHFGPDAKTEHGGIRPHVESLSQNTPFNSVQSSSTPRSTQSNVTQSKDPNKRGDPKSMPKGLRYDGKTSWFSFKQRLESFVAVLQWGESECKDYLN